MFNFLIEEVRLVVEKMTTADRVLGLQRTTKHSGYIDRDRNFMPSGHVEKNPAPTRKKPAPKRGYDPHPDRVKAHSDTLKKDSQEIAKGVRSWRSDEKRAAGDAIRKLRQKRDEPSKLKARKAEAARRLPMPLPGRKK